MFCHFFTISLHYCCPVTSNCFMTLTFDWTNYTPTLCCSDTIWSIILSWYDFHCFHIWCPSDTVAFDTEKSYTKYDDCFWWPIKVLILMDVFIPEIYSCFIRLLVIKFSWLQLSNVANVIISFLKFSCWIFTTKTHAKNFPNSNGLTLNIFDVGTIVFGNLPLIIINFTAILPFDLVSLKTSWMLCQTDITVPPSWTIPGHMFGWDAFIANIA